MTSNLNQILREAPSKSQDGIISIIDLVMHSRKVGTAGKRSRREYLSFTSAVL